MATVEALSKVAPKNLPSPPFILLQGIPNLRDIGGYPLLHPTTAARSVRRGLVYRSADTSAAPHFPNTCTELKSTLHVTTVYDLRSTAEVERGTFGPPLAVDGIERIHAPTNKEDMSPEAISLRYRDYSHGGDDGFTRAYSDILKSAGPSMGRIARHLLTLSGASLDRKEEGKEGQEKEQERQAILIHCSAGKDRTGILTMLLLSLAGCSDATVAEEYALTTQGLQGIREAIVEHLMKRPDMAGDRAAAERMTGSRAEAMMQTLALLRRDYNGAEGWLQGVAGLTADECARLKALLTSDEEPIFPEKA